MTPIFRFAGLSILGGVVTLAACSSSNPGTGGDGGVIGDGGSGPLIGVPAHHVPSEAACRSTRPPGQDNSGFSCPDSGVTGGAYQCCTQDSDCTTGTNGRCTITGNGGPSCTYDECSTSSDCSAGKSCGCGDIFPSSYNKCVTSNCRTDSDCGPGGYCSPSLDFTCGTYGGEYGGIYCHTSKDQCLNDSDCGSSNGRCSYNPETTRWECATGACAG